MSSRPTVIVQLSDPHIGATWADGDPVAGLSIAVASIARLRPTPDALVLTGDLADTLADSEYAQVLSSLEGIDAPCYTLPGNHDDRDGMRRHFGIPGEPGTPVQYAVELGALRILMLDSTRPGADSGEFDAGRLAWLEDALSADPHTPTLLAMHHPPLVTHVPGLDALALAAGDRVALGDVVSGHPNVMLIIAGHVHRPISGELAGRRVLSAPSTYIGFELDLTTEQIDDVATPPGYVVHVFRDGELASHVVSLPNRG
ncbi:MAG TPA: phosphodiesterase [Solirubrobacteraceae bacterium]|nr:phosphodiesterase [Solirubrobacteraceae bacterium]